VVAEGEAAVAEVAVVADVEAAEAAVGDKQSMGKNK
jgi:hypothetical protein